MAARKPLTLLGRHFPRQLDAIGYFREMLGRYKLGDAVAGEDSDLLLCLLQRHVHLEEKVGAGIDRLVVMLSPEGTPCFGIRRIDGTEVEFSFRRCITQIWT